MNDKKKNLYKESLSLFPTVTRTHTYWTIGVFGAQIMGHIRNFYTILSAGFIVFI